MTSLIVSQHSLNSTGFYKTGLNKTNFNKQRANGFSLIELMIALVVGLVLITGMISVFSGNSRSANLNQSIARLQEDARYALEAIAKDVRMTGFQGCTTVGESYLSIIAEDAPLDDSTVGLTQSAIALSSATTGTTWSPALPWGDDFSPSSTYPAVVGTDILALQFGDSMVYSLDAPVGLASPSVAGLVQIEGDPADINISTGDLAIISDCQGGDLFHVTNTTDVGTTAMRLAHAAGNSQNSSGALTRIYGNTETLLRQAMVMRFHANVYFVGDTGLTNERGDAVTSLYLQSYPFDSTNPPVELVQGVEQLAVSVTQVDDSGNVQNISAGDTAFAPAQVQAVRIGLLISSYDNIADNADSKTYVIAGKSVVPAIDAASGDLSHPGDRRMRLAFNTTVKVRNTRAPE